MYRDVPNHLLIVAPLMNKEAVASSKMESSKDIYATYEELKAKCVEFKNYDRRTFWEIKEKHHEILHQS